MPRKWIRDREWQRQPHVKEGPPPSLWWFRRPDHHRVIREYTDQCSRGRTVPENFDDELIGHLDTLNRLQSLKPWGRPRTFRYWSAPSYALAQGLKAPALMKRLREMEKIARRLFPDSVPASRKARPPLTDEERQEMRRRYLAGEDCKALAKYFRISPAQVGRLCATEKAQRAALSRDTT